MNHRRRFLRQVLSLPIVVIFGIPGVLIYFLGFSAIYMVRFSWIALLMSAFIATIEFGLKPASLESWYMTFFGMNFIAIMVMEIPRFDKAVKSIEKLGGVDSYLDFWFNLVTDVEAHQEIKKIDKKKNDHARLQDESVGIDSDAVSQEEIVVQGMKQ